jgi:hypothetical protein
MAVDQRAAFRRYESDGEGVILVEGQTRRLDGARIWGQAMPVLVGSWKEKMDRLFTENRKM